MAQFNQSQNYASFYYCPKCIMWIPWRFSDIHIKECHRNGCSMLHPMVKDGYLIAQINIIEMQKTKDKSQKNGQRKLNRGKWIICDEPGIMERMNFSFTERFAFFNEIDLYHCGIEAFSPVSLQVHALEAVFVAVPYDVQEMGTIRLFEKALPHHFPISDETSLVSVKKIINLNYGERVKLKVPVDEDKITLQRCFEKDFMYDFNYGLPFLFKNNDNVTIKGLDGHPCEVRMEIISSIEKDISSIGEEQSLFKQPDTFSHSETLLNSTLEHLHISTEMETKSQAKMIESFDENCLIQNSFQTSTPKREENCASFSNFKTEKFKTKRKTKKKKVPKTNDSFEAGGINTQILPYNFISNYSEIEVITKDGNPIDFVETNENFAYYRNDIFYNLKDIIKKKLKLKNNYLGRNLHSFWNGILISGYPGTGKTTLIKQISIELSIPLITVSLYGWSKSSSQNYIDDCFNEAKKCSPSILLFDEMDSMCHQTRGKNSDFLDTILRTTQKLKSLQTPVILIGATSRPESLPQRIRQAGRFDKNIILNLPDPKTRSSILFQLLDGKKHSLSQTDVDMLGVKAFGYSPSDLKSAIQNSWRHSVSRWKMEKEENGTDLELKLQLQDVENGFEDVVPFFLRENYSAVSQVQWSDIWGYDDIKTKLKKMIESNVSGNNLRGILLYGPPGCSKTMIVRALATETNFSFFPVKCSDMLSKYVGETEKSLCRVFEKATLGAPSIIFMDEVDSLCGERSGGGTENTVIPELLSLLQKSLKTGNVLVIGATNRPQALDEALLSPGCLELLLHIDLPNCLSRCAIWNGLLDGIPKLAIDTYYLCERSKGYSCAEICEVYQRSAHSLLESLCREEILEEEMNLSEEIIIKYLNSTAPRTSHSLLVAIQSFMSIKK